MGERKNNTRMIIGILISVIIILLIVIIYAFVVKPAINGMIVQGYNQGAQDVIIKIAQESIKCQQVPLVIGNQTINIVAVDCLQSL